MSRCSQSSNGNMNVIGCQGHCGAASQLMHKPVNFISCFTFQEVLHDMLRFHSQSEQFQTTMLSRLVLIDQLSMARVTGGLRCT